MLLPALKHGKWRLASWPKGSSETVPLLRQSPLFAPTYKLQQFIANDLKKVIMNTG